jgi:hypothetical protein
MWNAKPPYHFWLLRGCRYRACVRRGARLPAWHTLPFPAPLGRRHLRRKRHRTTACGDTPRAVARERLRAGNIGVRGAGAVAKRARRRDGRFQHSTYNAAASTTTPAVAVHACSSRFQAEKLVYGITMLRCLAHQNRRVAGIRCLSHHATATSPPPWTVPPAIAYATSLVLPCALQLWRTWRASCIER